MKTCRLFVSARASIEPPLSLTGDSARVVNNIELCGGHRLEVTADTSEDYVKCITERGEEVWIQEAYVSHAK